MPLDAIMRLAGLPFDIQRAIFLEARSSNDKWALACSCQRFYVGQRLLAIRARLDNLATRYTVLCLSTTLNETQPPYLAHQPLVVLQTELRGDVLRVHFGRVPLPEAREELNEHEVPEGAFWMEPATLKIHGRSVSLHQPEKLIPWRNSEDEEDEEDLWPWNDPNKILVVEWSELAARGARVARLTGAMVRRATWFHCGECHNSRRLGTDDYRVMRTRWRYLTRRPREYAST